MGDARADRRDNHQPGFGGFDFYGVETIEGRFLNLHVAEFKKKGNKTSPKDRFAEIGK